MHTLSCENNNKNSNMLVSVPALGSIDAYIYWVNQIPMLTATEELELATRFRQNGDLEAARKLVLAHLRFVVSVAKNYAGYGLPKSDLIQEGNIGLMKAVKRFNPELNVRLVSFAIHWIKSEIHEFVLRNWRIVKIATTKAQRKLFFNLRRYAKKLGWFSEEEIANIAQELAVAPQEVRTMELRLRNTDIAFDKCGDNEEQEVDEYNPVDYLASDTPDPADEIANFEIGKQRNIKLTEFLAKLDQRSREILERRWLQEPKATLHELAARYNLSAERIRQIEENILRKLKTALGAKHF